MIKLIKGNIFDADVEALVNPVNCVGVMGKGLALQFKKRYPDNYKSYKIFCDKKLMYIGSIHTTTGYPVIINFPTKIHWRDKSTLANIEVGLEFLIKAINHHGVKSIAIPPLGCGLGGLKWDNVLLLITEWSDKLPNVYIEVYEPTTKE